jgi:intracellular sulfur oxidation DsrE/DsrF family protein
MTARSLTTLLWRALFALCLVFQQSALADEQADKSEPAVRVDIPVKLDKADVVFNMNHLVLRGDMSVGLRYMDTMAKGFKDEGTKSQIIGIFYSEAGHLTLNDKAYNAYRGITTGNPYKTLIADLINRGVQIEECAETMKNHHWGNEDLLPGVKVNAGAVRRLVQLTQQGFVQIQP